MMTFATLLGLSLSPFVCALASGDLKLSNVFSDHMVLQRDMPVPVWGWAKPGDKIAVEFAGQRVTATADDMGKWSVRLARLSAAAIPSKLIASLEDGSAKQEITDVLVGEVWLCSGQSNMQMRLGATADFEKEQALANFPMIRVFEEKSTVSPVPTEQPNGAWVPCSPVTVRHISAVTYYFGRNLYQKLNMPIGLINSSVGGSLIETWTSLEAIQGKTQFEPLLKRWAQNQADWKSGKTHAAYEKQLALVRSAPPQPGATPVREPQPPGDPLLSTQYPGNFFNSKISPIIPYAMRGAIWYQGESNAGSTPGSLLYADQLRALFGDWRARWGQGDFPVAWVQLPNFIPPRSGANGIHNWAIIRESMLKALDIPNSGMVVAIDMGEAGDIHPKEKRPVAQRLAAWALAKVYGQEIPFSGPLFSRIDVKGEKMVVSFAYVEGGLVAKGGDVKGFTLAGADRQWKPAKAKISGDQVIVSCPDVPVPVAVRYAWADNPECNLFNGAGFPGSPFRSDNWEFK